MTQEKWELLVGIFRDCLIVTLGTFMLVFETVFRSNPNIEIIAAGAALLGVPTVLRLDVRASNGKRKRLSSSSEDDEERWSHLP